MNKRVNRKIKFLTMRLSADQDKSIEQLKAIMKTTRSGVLRNALQQYVSQRENTKAEIK